MIGGELVAEEIHRVGELREHHRLPESAVALRRKRLAQGRELAVGHQATDRTQQVSNGRSRLDAQSLRQDWWAASSSGTSSSPSSSGRSSAETEGDRCPASEAARWSSRVRRSA